MERCTRRRVLAGLTTGAMLGLAGCSSGQLASTATATQATLAPDARYGYTHVQPSGNRRLDGPGTVAKADPVDIDTAEPPAWLVALPAARGSFWTAVSAGGRARTYRVADGSAETVVEHRALPAGVPPLVRRKGSGAGLVRPPGGAAPRTHPVVTGAGLLVLAENGDLVLHGERGTRRWSVDGLPDGRIVHVAGSRYALLGDATTRYKHAALGDQREGGSLVVFDAGEPTVTVRTRIGPPEVIEGIAPLVADLDGDGRDEIVVTIADSRNGARIAVYDRAGRELATGPIYGPGWRHQLAVADFGVGRELAVTRKPHVDHVVEFYRLSDGSLSVTAEYPNVSTHTYGSHNTDGAVAGDLDGDGTAELLVPHTDRTSLLVVGRTSNGAETAWQWSLDGRITSNLAGTTLAGGGVAVGVGIERGLRVWQG